MPLSGLVAAADPALVGTASEVPAIGGADSPEAAVGELLESVRLSDPLGILAVVHPSERQLLDGLYSSASASAEATGGVDVDALLQSLRVDVQPSQLIVEQLTDDRAWVTAEDVNVSVDVDVAAADAAIAGDLSDASFDGFTESFEPAEDDLGIAVVRDGDRWFVSALYTAAETGRRVSSLRPLFPSAAGVQARAASPTEAVTALVGAVAAKDPLAAASYLTPFEGGLVADYEPTIGAELLDALEPYTLSLTADHVNVIEQDEKRAVVEVDVWSFAVTGEDDDGDRLDFSLSVDGMCGTTRDYDSWDEEYEESSGCAFEDSQGPIDVFSVLPDGGWQGPRFVVLNVDGVWSVSLLQSVLYSLTPVASDPLTALATVEFADGLFRFMPSEFYEVAIEILGANAPLLAAGESVVPTSGVGRVATFRLAEPGELRVESDAEVCLVYVLWFEEGFLSGEQDDCGVPIEVTAPDSIVFVSSSERTPFTGIEPLGEVRVTVT